MRKLNVLLALTMMAACLLSMSAIAKNEYTNDLNLSANVSAGNISLDVLILSEKPFGYSLNVYPSKVVYHPATGTADNYDGFHAADDLVLREGDIVYDSFCEQITFGDNATRQGMIQLFYYAGDSGAPSMKIYEAATRTAMKTLPVQGTFGDHYNDFLGHPCRGWDIISPYTNVKGMTSFTRLNDRAILAITCDYNSYSQMAKKMRFWGL